MMKLLYRWAWGFFGLGPDARSIIHDQIFDLIYHGNGGFTWSDVYNMPSWLRKYYIKKINEAIKKHNKEVKKANKSSSFQKPAFTGFGKK